MVSISLISLPVNTRQDPSANSNRSQETDWGMSFTYSKNNKGPSVDPCGTLHVRSFGLQNSSPTFTLYILFAKCALYHFIVASEKPRYLIFGVTYYDQ